MRDARGRSPDPKVLGDLLGDFRKDVGPATPLAAVQGVWEEVVGERIAAVTEVTGERDGVVTVVCSTAVWAQELELMAPRILTRLRDQVGDSTPERLRFRTSN